MWNQRRHAPPFRRRQTWQPVEGADAAGREQARAFKRRIEAENLLVRGNAGPETTAEKECPLWKASALATAAGRDMVNLLQGCNPCAPYPFEG